MTSPFAAINAIFNRPRGAAAVLFLIEDSCYMDPLWQRLRDSYLPSLLNAIKDANPSAVAEALWMTTSERAPFKPPFDSSDHRAPHWDDIPAINFSLHGGDGVSPTNVTHAIEALSTTFGRGPATRHLVVVSALNPSANTLGPRRTPDWSTPVEHMNQEEIRMHLITQSQSVMEGLVPSCWELIGKGQVCQADDAQFSFYLSDLYDKGKESVGDNQRVPNSGLRSRAMISDGTPASSTDKLSLVYQLQKLNGVEKKRRSRTRRDQPTTNKPGQPYQKNSPHPRTKSPTAQLTSPGPGRSPPVHKADPRVSRVEASSSYFDPLPPRASPHAYGAEYPPTTSPSRGSSSSSPYYPSTGASPSPGSRNLSSFRGTLPIPIPSFDHFQHVVPTMQSTPNSLSPSSPGYIPRHFVTQTITADGSHPATAQFNDFYGPNRSHFNECDRKQGRIESIHLRPTAPYPAPNDLVPGLTHRPEKTTVTFPPVSHGLAAPVVENPSGYFYSGYEDRTTGRLSQTVALVTDRSSKPDGSTAFTVIHM